MNTLGTGKSAKILIEEGDAIAQSFVCNTKLENGVMVKLTSDGKIAPITVGTEKPIGFVSIGNKEAGGKATVLVPFVTVIKAVADGTVTAGDDLIQTGVTADGFAKLKTATQGNYISAIALETSATGNQFKAGILKTNLKS